MHDGNVVERHFIGGEWLIFPSSVIHIAMLECTIRKGMCACPYPDGIVIEDIDHDM